MTRRGRDACAVTCNTLSVCPSLPSCLRRNRSWHLTRGGDPLLPSLPAARAPSPCLAWGHLPPDSSERFLPKFRRARPPGQGPGCPPLDAGSTTAQQEHNSKMSSNLATQKVNEHANAAAAGCAVSPPSVLPDSRKEEQPKGARWRGHDRPGMGQRGLAMCDGRSSKQEQEQGGAAQHPIRH